jgi:hypothetical protein
MHFPTSSGRIFNSVIVCYVEFVRIYGYFVIIFVSSWKN